MRLYRKIGLAVVWLALIGTYIGFVELISAPKAYAQIQIRGDKENDTGLTSQTYGPITGQDTLWKIAEQLKPDSSISTYQVMVAIYQANPNAFNNNNLNSMRSGAILQVPTLSAMRKVNKTAAKNKSDLDDEIWADRQNKAIAAQQDPQEKKRQETAKQADLETAKNAIQDRLQQLQQEQLKSYQSLKEQFSASLTNIQALIEENERLKNRLASVNEEVTDLRSQVGQGSQLQLQMETILAQQTEMLEQQRKELAEKNDSALTHFWKAVSSNILYLILLGTVPGLILVGLLIWWLLVRKKQPDQQEQANHFNQSQTTEPEFTPSNSSMPTDDLFENQANDFSASPIQSSSSEQSIRLDDDDLLSSMDHELLMDDDDLLDSPMNSEVNSAKQNSADVNFGDDILDQSLDDLVNDESHDDLDDIVSEDDIDALLETVGESNQKPLTPEVDKQAEKEPTEESSELSQDELDSLFNGLNDDNEDELLPPISNAEKVSNATELIDENDIDSLIDDTQQNSATQPDDLDDDELDSLLDEDMAKNKPINEDEVDENVEIDDLLDSDESAEDDEFDIDALIDDTQTDSVTETDKEVEQAESAED
ncbi:hypothetical protein N7931_03395, partial [Catenovulum sp. 2E275]|uniref:FimV/HubP family polar landmark protein n=1 Tax=Catenovulum sp. 2E275 TaxID=2980497 RepID=UPI00292A5501